MSSRTKKKKEVIFPLLQKAVEHVDDDHWKTLFDNLSKGNAPKRISIIALDCNSDNSKRASKARCASA